MQIKSFKMLYQECKYSYLVKEEHQLGIQEVYYAIRYIFLRVILMYVLKYLFHARMVDLIKTLSLMDQIF